MKAIILLNGEPYEKEIDASNAHVYCCDGAYAWAKHKVRIDETLGDFDSLSEIPTPPPAEVFPSEKDYTDGEIALLRAIEAGYSEIEIYGGGGKREDHFIGNLHLLFKASERGVRATLVTNYAKIFAAEGRIELNGEKGKTVSVTPFGSDAHIIDCDGFYYQMPETFVYGSTRGISNVVTADRASFKTEGKVLVFVNNEEVSA
ncbi:MAG: thiamine diphosphokinase [Clostridia bacterium]|nr:thiamine diphosphokinase [Clostridia bacterium]